LFGFIVGSFSKSLYMLPPADARRLLAPCMILLIVLALASDSDNILFGAIKRGTVPCVLIFLSSAKFRVFAKVDNGYGERPAQRVATKS
jgi:hypothetical protein